MIQTVQWFPERWPSCFGQRVWPSLLTSSPLTSFYIHQSRGTEVRFGCSQIHKGCNRARKQDIRYRGVWSLQGQDWPERPYSFRFLEHFDHKTDLPLHTQSHKKGWIYFWWKAHICYNWLLSSRSLYQKSDYLFWASLLPFLVPWCFSLRYSSNMALNRSAIKSVW